MLQPCCVMLMGGKAVLAHAETHFHVRLVGPRHGISDLTRCNWWVPFVGAVGLVSSGYMNNSYSFHVTSHCSIQKRLDFHLMLRPSSALRFGLARRAAHQKFAARNGHHRVRDFGPRNGVGIKLHVRLGVLWAVVRIFLNKYH